MPRMSSPRAISACDGDERRGADHLRVAARLARRPAPVGERGAAGVAHLDVRDDREHAVAHFLLEAVHHRQDDDQRGDAEGDAEHRHAGDERDEAVPAPGPAGSRVAPADLQFVGPVHAGAMLPDRPRAFAPRGRSDNRRMHLLVPFASDRSEACRHVLHDLALPNLERLLALLTPAGRDEGDAGSFSPPHERALAAALGLARRRRPAAVRGARRRRRRRRHRRRWPGRC